MNPTTVSDVKEGNNQQQGRNSPQQCNSSTVGGAAPKGTAAAGSELLEENTESQPRNCLEDEEGPGIGQGALAGASEASTVDIPPRTPREAKLFFMLMLSPCTQLDHASQGSTFPYAGRDLHGVWRLCDRGRSRRKRGGR